MNKKLGEYGKDFMKIKFNSDDSLPSNKILKLYNLKVIFRSVSRENDKYYLNGVDYRCMLRNITRNDGINRLNSSKLDDKDTL